MFCRVFFLAFLFALDIHAARVAWRESEVVDQRSAISSLSRISDHGSRITLPNSCELLAAEAYAKMRRAGIWARILIVRYSDQNEGHAYCVFQPSFQIVAYDEHGSVELATASRDPQVIARVLGARKRRPIISGRFLE